MNAVIIDGRRKNKLIDALLWLVALGILIGTPLLVGLLRTPPAKGPTLDPSVMIIFMTLMGLIGVTMLGMYGVLFTKNADKPIGLNMINAQAKFIGALFLISGLVKLQDPVGFAYKLDEYWDVFQNYLSFFPNDFMKGISVPFAAFVSVIEVTLAIALMLGWRMRLTSTILLLMILFFTGLTGFSAITGAVTDCGCFGDALKLTPTQTFLKDILLTLAILPFFFIRKRLWAFYANPVPKIGTFLAFLLPAALSLYCYLYYPIWDFRGAYVVGQDLAYNSGNFNAEGEVIAHDFTEFGGDCAQEGFVGPTLYIFLYNIGQAPQKALDAAAALATELKTKAPGILVAGGTNITAKERAKLPLKFDADFCWSSQDEKMLKTVVRSSPGYLFMKDGIILKKWHYNSIPSADELIALAGDAAKLPRPLPTVGAPDVAPDSSGMDSSGLAPAN